MGRIARVVVPGLPHHVTQRGNHSEDVFFSNEDRAVYLWLVRKYAEKYHLRVQAYCLMTNHVHLVVVPEREDSLARALGRTHNDYARWLHVRQGRTGHLWQNRFYSCVLGGGHVWRAMRYVELNPVRAGMVERAWDWRWSSALAHLGQRPDEWLDLADWCEVYTAAEWRERLESGTQARAEIEELRNATRTGRPWGEKSWVVGLEKRVGRTLRPQRPGPKPADENGQGTVRWSSVVA
jgi:putative transposase